MGDDLKPCPWCGRVPVRANISGGGPAYWVECYRCEATGPVDTSGSLDNAADAWNRRPAEDALRARAEAAEQRAEALAAELAQARAERDEAAATAGAAAAITTTAQVAAARMRSEAAQARDDAELERGRVAGLESCVATRNEALAEAHTELAQARADRALLAGLWLGTVPHDVLPALFPTDQGDRDRLAAALDAVDRQIGAEARIAAGRAVIARIVAEMGGGAA